MIRYRRIGAFLALAGLSGAAGAALWDRQRPVPAPTTLLTLSTCGLVPAPDPVALPLAAWLDAAAALDTGAAGLGAGLVLGPIRHAGLDEPLWLRFEARAAGAPGFPLDTSRESLPDSGAKDGAALRPPAEGAVVVLPVARDRLPGAIHLGCRHGRVSDIRHRNDGVWHSPGGIFAPTAGAAPRPAAVQGAPEAGLGAPVAGD